MDWSSVTCGAVLLTTLSISAQGAEVSCHLSYVQKPISEELAQRAWPSGSRPTADTCRYGLIRGELSKGDYDQVVNFYRQNHPFLEEVLLASPGGDADEAMQIGKLFRKYLITAHAPVHYKWDPDHFILAQWARVCEGPSCICASACALIWFGSPQRIGAVGLHRPYTQDPAFKALAPAEASAAYKQMLGRVSQYLGEMEVPTPIIETMISTGSGEIHWLEDGTENRPPSFTEWKDAACWHFTDREYKSMLRLSGQEFLGDPLSDDEKLLLKALSEKSDTKKACEDSLVSSNREKMKSP
jgi:hypothetical protein